MDNGLTVNGLATMKSGLTVNGDLTVDGNVKFSTKNSNIMEIFPRYMVIAWADNDIPQGWVICDGQVYTIDSNDGTYKVVPTTTSSSSVVNTSIIKTPDLRGRFILGAGSGKQLTLRRLNDFGGEEKHQLSPDEMASHTHHTFVAHPLNGVNSATGNWDTRNSPASIADGIGDKSYRITYSTNSPNVGLTSGTGGNQPHENMPPYYVLTYIMKL